MPDNERTERILQSGGLPFSYNRNTIRIHSETVSDTVLNRLDEEGWRVQEVLPNDVVIAPKPESAASGEFDISW